MKILIDWLQFTTTIHSKLQILEMFGLQDQEWVTGKPTGRWSNVDINNKIRIEYGGEREDISFTFSGSGCRYVETVNDNEFDWLQVLSYLCSFKGDGVNISRLDVACDDKEIILTMKKIMKHAEDRKYVSRSRVKPMMVNGRKEIIYFGSEKSDTMLRIYNKALERGLDDEHWIRAELQLRNEAADSFIINLQEYKDIGITYAGILNNYLRFTTKNPNTCNEHYDQLIVTKWWKKFISESRKIKNISTGGMEYNYENLENFIKTGAGSSIKTYLMANNGDVTKLLELISDCKINDKQKQMLSNLELYKEDAV